MELRTSCLRFALRNIASFQPEISPRSTDRMGDNVAQSANDRCLALIEDSVRRVHSGYLRPDGLRV